MEAMNAGREIEKIFLLNNLHPAKLADLKKAATMLKIPFQFVPKEKLNRLTRQNHQGVVAFVSPITYARVEDLIPGLYESGKTPFLLILDKITDVRNLGSIARTAECAGVHAIILPSRGSALINADALKTSAGALNNLDVCRVPNLKETIQFLKNSGIAMIAATEKAKKNVYQVDLKKPVAVIMGSEEKGVSEAYLELCDEMVKIPMMGETQSLNVSVATGIVLFEAVKQRI
ncbi:MAG: 23S rRNA (guanosine(2251)-2'-O)-methyltransferase RlmB [Bacteroidetes bacterium]|nr:23S rRNA (guanosine(2251)-2'-O)-methyltransferase RlmB [Bacteroidota bacterium]